MDDEGGLVLPGVPTQGPMGRAVSTSTFPTAPTTAANANCSPPASSSPPHHTSPGQQQQQQQSPTETAAAKQQGPRQPQGSQGQCVTDPELALRILQAGGATWGMEVSADGKGLVLSASESN